MASVAVLLPCGRDFDKFGFKISKAVLSLKVNHKVVLYLGIKKSNYDRSLLKDQLPTKVIWIFESEQARSCAQFFNKAYEILKEDCFIVLVDDYVITGNIFGIIDFIKAKNVPAATFGIRSDIWKHDDKPNEIAYYPESIGHGGSKGAHPTFNATNVYCANTNLFNKLFTKNLYELERYYSDDLLAFKLQTYYKFIIPVWVAGTIWATKEPATSFSPGYTPQEEYIKYIDKIKDLEEKLKGVLLL